MAGIPKVKITFDADFDQLKQGVSGAQNEVEGFSGKMEKFGKAAAAAFALAAAAAVAYAGKLAIDGVKAALEDEQAQLKLAGALTAATGATNLQIKSTEDYISKMQLATGVSDDELRASMQRLVVSVKDVGKSQDLLNLALDISKGTGKDLASVTEALAKSYEGQDGKLGKLGIGISAADLKQKNFTQTVEALTDLYGGAAAKNADTYQGRIDRLTQAFNEGKEAVGYKLLPILGDLVAFITDKIIPNIGKFIALFDPLKNAIISSKEIFTDFGSSVDFSISDAFTNIAKVINSIFIPVWNAIVRVLAGLKSTIGDNLEAFKEFAGYITTYLAPVIGTFLGAALSVAGKLADGIITVVGSIVRVLNGLISGAIDGINALIRAYNAIPFLGDIPTIAKPTAPTPSASPASPTVVVPSAPSFSAPSSSSNGGVATASASAVAASSALQSQVSGGQSVASIIATANQMAPTNTYNLYVTGAIDPQGTSRAIVDTLNNAYYAGGGGGAALVQ